MNLFETVKHHQLCARKVKDHIRAGALTCVIGDAQQTSKEPSDDQVMAVIKKHIKSIDATEKQIGSLPADMVLCRQILQSYLPAPMTDAEVGLVVANVLIAHDKPNMGIVVAAVKKEAAKLGKLFDGAQVGRVFDIYK